MSGGGTELGHIRSFGTIDEHIKCIPLTKLGRKLLL